MNILLFIPKDITTNTNVKKVDLIGFQTYHILKNVHKVCIGSLQGKDIGIHLETKTNPKP